jgi:UDP-glucuronate 4-epimerase
MNLLITGSSGFIGYHVATKLLKTSYFKKIVGVDNMNSYYDINLKKNRLKKLKKLKKFKFYLADCCNKKIIKKIIIKNKINYIIHLAAQAGVRDSISDPDIYYKYNVDGFYNIINLAKEHRIKHLVYASTSGVYGDAKRFPLSENDNTNNPLSFYAATKKINEIIAYSYSHIYKLPTTGLRFFTVYGPFGRPDMSLYMFVKNIFNKKKIDLFNFGNHLRDFTYIDDLVNFVKKIIKIIPNGRTPYEIYNVCSKKPVSLNFYIKLIEKKIGIKSKKNYLKLQVGDVVKSHGENKKIKNITKNFSLTKIKNGIDTFVEWYKKYHNV